MKFAGDLNRHIYSLSFDLTGRPLHNAASLVGVSKPVSWIPSFGSGIFLLGVAWRSKCMRYVLLASLT